MLVLKWSDIYFNHKKRDSVSPSATIKLLTVGNWDGYEGRKRHHILLRFFADATKQIPSLHLSMVGLSSGNIEELREICQDMGISKNVDLQGYLSDLELSKEYLENYIYVTATTYEGFYRQIVEGFASGMPALAFNSALTTDEVASAASANHINKSGGGRLFEDSESFLSALKDILDHYHEFSQNAYNYSKRFSKEMIGYKTDRLLNEILEGEMNGRYFHKRRL